MHNGKIIAPDTGINVENIVINVTSEADKKPKKERDYFLVALSLRGQLGLGTIILMLKKL